MNGTELHVLFMAGTAAQKAKAREQALWWSKVANLSFVFDDDRDARIEVGVAARQFRHQARLARRALEDRVDQRACLGVRNRVCGAQGSGHSGCEGGWG